ncbi:MAG: orotate phosphoribosyltransferase [Oenococcus sp.]|uniref:orotate phosphoribosyltransferase n=1 Tax=Oenococcus TaxID=46254 RepID=UPI0021E98C72|nr:orotate phosphoribosyltransferase [Oenococcus kitaharae]MCV3296815.1 orotate phosphoribosyltransferase [Oenococcus kitaharae]
MTHNYSKEVAEDLLTIQAVKFVPEDPFTWASGIVSPIYTDNRLTIAFPKVRDLIAAGLAELAAERFPKADIIGGVATAGIPHAALVADRLAKPMIYVRAKPKDHGRGKQIEGADVANKSVLLIDDLFSTGGSVLGAGTAVQAAGGRVVGLLAIFSYELKALSENFAAAGLDYAALTNYTQLAQAAVARGDLDASQIETLKDWHQDPKHWRK